MFESCMTKCAAVFVSRFVEALGKCRLSHSFGPMWPVREESIKRNRSDKKENKKTKGRKENL